jgi:hypothetical protein
MRMKHEMNLSLGICLNHGILRGTEILSDTEEEHQAAVCFH